MMGRLALVALAAVLLFASFGCVAQGQKSGEVEVRIGNQEPISADYFADETVQAGRAGFVSSKYSGALEGIDNELGNADEIIRNSELASSLSFSLYRSSQFD